VELTKRLADHEQIRRDVVARHHITSNSRLDQTFLLLYAVTASPGGLMVKDVRLNAVIFMTHIHTWSAYPVDFTAFAVEIIHRFFLLCTKRL
jgi:hypothetical protein